MRTAAAAAGALLVCICAAVAAPTPEQTASAFYGVYAGFRPSDGIPDAKARALYDPVISPTLERLLTRASEANTRYLKGHKDSPPLIEGDLFTSNFEGATSFHVGRCESNAGAAHCVADLVYARAGQKPVTWTDTLKLVRTGTDWRVDDIVYGGTAAFGNTGRLTQTVAEAIREAGE
ncbi:MAG: DUF3828 domain-containing protein [Alphaproteobacteria bacterium]|nr:DUF3828 domain-containing protein [Alphaproteobacteria bacterium]